MKIKKNIQIGMLHKKVVDRIITTKSNGMQRSIIHKKYGAGNEMFSSTERLTVCSLSRACKQLLKIVT